MHISRRDFFVAAACLYVARGWADENVFAELERQTGGQLGVAALDTGTGTRMEYRAEERFPLCSTFKFLLASAVLSRIDVGKENPDRTIAFGQSDIIMNSPVTSKHIGGMSVWELLQAIVQYSDNTAANLLLASLGGPSGWTAYARTIGDQASRLDRIELDLNFVGKNDLRDTTTPAAMLKNVQTVLLGNVLSSNSRDQLEAWMASSTTGLKRLRAGIPRGWKAADKSGTSYTAHNDIALLRPPGRAPILVCAYTRDITVPDEKADEVLAKVGRAIAQAIK